MATNILIYDIARDGEKSFKSHYRIYNIDRVLLAEGNYVYTIQKPRKMPPAVLRSKVVTGIIMRLTMKGVISRKDHYTSECLVSKDVLLQEMEGLNAPTKPEKVVKAFTQKVSVEENPRLFSVQYVNGNYTIIKATTPYLTREQAKDLLFEKTLGSK